MRWKKQPHPWLAPEIGGDQWHTSKQNILKFHTNSLLAITKIQGNISCDIVIISIGWAVRGLLVL